MRQIFHGPVGQAAGRDINNVDVHHHSSHTWPAMDDDELSAELTIKRRALRTAQYRYWANPKILPPMGAGLFVLWVSLNTAAQEPGKAPFLAFFMLVVVCVVWLSVRRDSKRERAAILHFRDQIDAISNELNCRAIERLHRRTK